LCLRPGLAEKGKDLCSIWGEYHLSGQTISKERDGGTGLT
jgi:hypothetical protein